MPPEGRPHETREVKPSIAGSKEDGIGRESGGARAGFGMHRGSLDYCTSVVI